MTIGVSCLLHLGLVTGLVLGQRWIPVAVPVRPPILPVQLVTLETPPEPAPVLPPPAPRERIRPPRLIEPARPKEPRPVIKTETPPPAPPTPAPTMTAPVETAPAAPAPEPASPATTIVSSVPSSGPSESAAPPSVAATPQVSTAIPEGVTQYARPQGGYQVRPTYPAAPRRLGIQGTTMLRVHVLADGRIGDVLVEKSAGHPELDEAAADAVRRWRFEPARRGAEAVAMWVLLPVEFRLR
jgi:protein TonB